MNMQDLKMSVAVLEQRVTNELSHQAASEDHIIQMFQQVESAVADLRAAINTMFATRGNSLVDIIGDQITTQMEQPQPGSIIEIRKNG